MGAGLRPKLRPRDWIIGKGQAKSVLLVRFKKKIYISRGTEEKPILFKEDINYSKVSAHIIKRRAKSWERKIK